MISAPLRSLLVVLGIALGVAVLVASQATSDSMLSSFNDMVQRVASGADLIVEGNQSGVDSSLVAKIAEIEGVKHVAAALEVTTQFPNDQQSLLILGVDFLGDTYFLPFKPEPGQQNVVEDPLAFANEPTAILISKKLAQRRGLVKDSPIELLTSEGVKTFHVRGVLEDSGPAASFGGQVAVMFLDAAQVAFARGTLVDRIDVALAEGKDAQSMARRIAGVVGKYARVKRPQEVGERLRALSKPLHKGLRLSGLIALLVGIFIIYNAIGVSVAQRRKETGLLRALGVIRRAVVAHFCIEAALLAIPGVILGLLLSRYLVVYAQGRTMDMINRVFVATPAAPRITLTHVIQGISAGILLSLVAAFIPAWRGASMDPVAALRPSAALVSASAIPYKILGIIGALLVLVSWVPVYFSFSGGGIVATLLNVCGAAMLAPWAMMLLRRMLVPGAEALFGISGRLGLDNVERNLGRSSVNVLALMVAVAMSVSVGGWLSSFERSIRDWIDQIVGTDLTITAGSPFADRRHVPLMPSALEKIADIEGIAEVVSVRVTEQQLGNQTFDLAAYDTRAYLSQGRRRNKSWEILEGRAPIEPDELREKPLIVFGENAARKFKLKVGDKISLPTATGVHTFEVRAVVVDYSSDRGMGFIDRRFYLEMWKDEAIDSINLFVKPEADVASVAELARRRLGGGQALFVTKTEDLKRQFFEAVDEGFSYSRSLEIIVLVIALLGVVGTMVAAVIDRIREIGMLRAIGCTRRQVITALVIEAAFLGLCAVACGVLTGTVQCLLFLRTVAIENNGWRLNFIFPLAGTLRIGALVILTSAVAGWLPGLRAARLEIKEALTYE